MPTTVHDLRTHSIACWLKAMSDCHGHRFDGTRGNRGLPDLLDDNDARVQQSLESCSGLEVEG